MGYWCTNSHDEGLGNNNGYIYGLEKHILDLFEEHLGWFKTEEERDKKLDEELRVNRGIENEEIRKLEIKRIKQQGQPHYLDNLIFNGGK